MQITLPKTLNSPEARLIITTLENAGGQARFVGGCVRDAILDITPGDIDIATTLLPQEVIALLEAEGIKVVPTGLKHGTVTAVINKKPFEITTLRRDVECFGRHATVAFTMQFEEDAARRDFTINAMYADLDGKLYDYFSGYEDLQHGKVHFVGSAKARVVEDYLRILRYFRFYARFGKAPMDVDALAAIKEHASSLDTLSGERIQREMLGLLALPKPSNVLETMAELHILAHIALPCTRFAAFKEMIMLEAQMGIAPNAIRRLAVLVRTLSDDNWVVGARGQPEYSLTKRWKLSNQDSDLLFLLVAASSRIQVQLEEKKQKHILRKMGKDHFTHMVLIAWAEFLAYEKESGKKLTTIFSDMLNLAESWTPPKFPLKGSDIMELGIDEGKEVGKLLSKAEEWWEEHNYQPAKAEILEYARDKLL